MRVAHGIPTLALLLSAAVSTDAALADPDSPRAVPAVAAAPGDSIPPASLDVSTGEPPGRYSHGAIVDPIRRRMVMHGGYVASVLNDQWELPLEGVATWSPIPSGGTATPMRSGHVAVLDPVRNRMLVFGGLDQVGRRNDTWALSLGDDQWSALTVAGTRPSPRSLLCGIYDPVRDRLIVFGGYEDQAYLNDVWALSLSGTPTWTLLAPLGTPPTPRRESSAIYDPIRDRMIIFGGTDGEPSDEVWELQLGEGPRWARLTPGGPPPAARSGQGAIYDPARDLMWIHGGRGAGGFLHADLWILRLSGSPEWQHSAVNGALPLPRAYHTATLDVPNDRMVVFSGYTGGLPGDTWFLRLSGFPEWYPLRSEPPPPPTEPDPHFDLPVTIAPVTSEVGQTFSVSISVKNRGLDTNDGVISLSFPDLIDPGDGEAVTSSSSGDTPGYSEHPAGSPLVSAECVPVTASYLTVEYRDDLWQGFSRERNEFTVKVSPRSPGTFRFYVRSTMRNSGAGPCVLVNDVPGGGASGFVDHQGFPVTQFAVTVRPLPPPPIPAFTYFLYLPPTPAPDALTLGQEIVIGFGVMNSGGRTYDGRVVFSFPVPCVADLPGPDHPAGSTLLDTECQPVILTYPVSETAGELWENGEGRTFTARITPTVVGAFYFDVRATMLVAGAPCEFRNAIPQAGTPAVDEQGWPVTRFHFTVGSAAPDPVFTAPIAGIPASITFGQSFTLDIALRNGGATSGDGRLVVGFPQLIEPTDADLVQSSTAGDSPGYRELRAGSPLTSAACALMTAQYLTVEYADNSWDGRESGAHEENRVQLEVRPRSLGDFIVDVRGTMQQGSTGCTWINGLPTDGESGFTDAQGWPVKRYRVHVTAPQVLYPKPVFQQPVELSATTITLGEALFVRARVRNDGADSDHGEIVMSFPSMTNSGDGQWITPAGVGGDAPGYQESPAGSPIRDAGCHPITASYLLVAYADDDWKGLLGGQESNVLEVFIRPQAVGAFHFYVRCALWETGSVCAYRQEVPSNGSFGYTDQQGGTVKRFSITVAAPPPVLTEPVPVFVSGPGGFPSTIVLGQSFTVTMSIRNDGLSSDDGRIIVSFPAFTSPTDDPWVAGTASGDAPGYREYPAGSALPGADCQTVTASYLAVEYADADWLPAGEEINTLSLTVVPQAVGVFSFDIRSAMHRPGGPPCDELDAIPAGGVGTFTDQQGREVRRFQVEVFTIPNPGTPSMSWSQIIPPPGGPAPRHGASFAHDELHDELFLYGGVGAEYFADIWSLPLAPGSSWRETLPGGSRPLHRIMHSMIHNPVEGHFVFFGGYYNRPLADLALLALHPVPWWFSIAEVGPTPGPRFGHTATYDPVRHRMLVIGGYDGGLRNDVWAYPLPGNGSWIKLEPLGTPIPARAQHAAVYDPIRDRVIVFGGDGGTFLRDVWELRLGVTPEWNRIAVTDLPPSGRRDHTLVYDSDRDRMLMFGGFDGTRRNDLWALTLADPPHWEQLYSTTTSPGPRAMHGAIYDQSRRRMVMFGGQVGTNGYSNEMWALTDNAPTSALASLVSTECLSDRVRLTWAVKTSTSIRVEIHRSAGESEGWTLAGSPEASGDRLVFEDRDVTPGTRLGYRLVELEEGGETVLNEAWVQVPQRFDLSLAGASPNPGEGDLHVAFSLPAEGAATLELFDLNGRLLAHRDVGVLGAGDHRVRFDDVGRVRAGIYLVRLVRGDRVLNAKVCVIR